MTVNNWIDENMNKVYGHHIRIIDSVTHKGVGDMLMLYMDKDVKGAKITPKFIFIFI